MMKKVEPVISNRLSAILEKIKKGGLPTVEDILSEWKKERSETAQRISAKLNFLYDRLFDTENRVQTLESQLEEGAS